MIAYATPTLNSSSISSHSSNRGLTHVSSEAGASSAIRGKTCTLASNATNWHGT